MDGNDSSARTADDARVALSYSHASDDPEDINVHLTANDGVTDYENDELSNSGENMMSASPSDNQLTESSARLLAMSDRQDALLDGNNSPSVPSRQNLLGNSTSRRTTEFTLVDTMTRCRSKDGNHNHESLSLHVPSEGGMSPSQDFDDERDPNYATQRPDTLGATINVAAAAAAANAFAGPVARPSYQVAAAARAWTMQSAGDDGSLADERTAHLGRRTCGAGMDQLELNQRQLMNASIDDENAVGDGSELCDDDDDDDEEEDDDTGLGSVNQCESTEADQYKMDPEADQTAGVVGSEAQQNGSSDDVRLGARRCTVGHRRRTDGAVSDTDDPEEDQASRAVCVDNAALLHPASVSLPADAANAMPAVCDEHQHGALKRHPQSAFSVPKPRVTKRKPGESATYSDRPVPSIRHSKSNTDIVFKPISTGHDSVTLRTLATSKSTDGSHVAGIMHGQLSHQSTEKKQLSTQDSGILSQDKKDVDRDVEPDHRRPGKQARDVNSASDGRSLWTRESLWNDIHTCSSVSLPSACHLPGEGGAIAVGTFAPANSSSQHATPEKIDTRACRMLDNSVDVSPIQPMSSSSSRPLSVNGSNVIDSASVNYMFPSAEFNIGMHASLPQYSHKVCLNLFYFICFFHNLCFFPVTLYIG